MSGSLAGKTVLVTGASSGLGLECARGAMAEGARMLAVSRSKTDELRAEFSEPAGHKVLACDVSEEAAVQALVQELKALGTAIDGWVLAAGKQDVRPLLMESRKSLESAWATNVYGSLGLLGAALKARLVAKGASIVLFSSAAAHAGGAGIVGYAATKGALEAATHSMAMELASQGIRVNAIAPGVVRTAMSSKYMSRMTAEQVAALEAQHPLGLGSPEQIADPVLFLLSERARWITGSILMIDGGLTSH